MRLARVHSGNLQANLRQFLDVEPGWTFTAGLGFV